MKKASWFILFLLMGVSCLDQPDCFRQNLNLVGISFKKMYDGLQDTVYIFKVSSPQTSQGQTFYDTIFVTSLSLPVDYLNDQKKTNYSIYRSATDTSPAQLGVTYGSKTQFVSEDCGARFLISGLDIIPSETSGFDSIRLVSSTLSNPAQTNIAVYRCPITNVMKIAFGQYAMSAGVSQTESKQIVSITTSYGSTLLYNPKVPVNSVRLPIDPNGTTSQFVFKFLDGSMDTLNVTYQQHTGTFFSRCGEQKTFRLDVNNIVTSFQKNLRFIRIRRDSLFDPPLTNIEVIRCPQNNLINVLFKTILTQGSATIRDSVILKSLTADYTTADLRAGITGKTPNITLPLDPNKSFTRFYFEMTRDTSKTILKDTLQVSYSFGTPVTYHDECGPITPIIQLQIDNTTFSNQTKVDDPSVKFPAVTNIEIVQ